MSLLCHRWRVVHGVEKEGIDCSTLATEEISSSKWWPLSSFWNSFLHCCSWVCTSSDLQTASPRGLGLHFTDIGLQLKAETVKWVHWHRIYGRSNAELESTVSHRTHVPSQIQKAGPLALTLKCQTSKHKTSFLFCAINSPKSAPTIISTA